MEDSAEERQLISDYLARYGGDFKVFTFSSAVDFLTGYQPQYDIVFMDIDMPYLDGMSAARKLREVDERVCLVFVTNLARLAVKGYEVSAFDFIVKPVSYADFSAKMPRILNRAELDKCSKTVLIRSGSDMVRVVVNEIMYVEVMSHRLVYHTADRLIESYGTLKSVEDLLSDGLFVRCNKCYLVNLRFVSAIEGGYAIVGGEKLLISYPRRAAFSKALADYLCG